MIMITIMMMMMIIIIIIIIIIITIIIIVGYCDKEYDAASWFFLPYKSYTGP